MSVAHILKAKSGDIITAKSTDTIATIAKTLSEKRIGAVIILNAAGRIEGIVSERDVVREIGKQGAKVLDATAATIMTRNVHTCAETDSESDLMTLMTERRIRHLPVVTNGKLLGMISIGDVVKYRIEAIEREAQEMKAYIGSAG